MQGNRRKWIGFAVSGLCFGLVILAVVSAWLGSEGIGFLFSGFCHQFSDRCYQIYGVALPVCVRCIWIYFGLAAGHILFLYWKPSTPGITRALIGVLGVMILDVLLEMVGFYENWFWSRALTGFLFGLVVSHFTLLGLQELYLELTNSKFYVRRKFFPGRTR